VHSQDYMLFSENIGEYLSIYEVSLSQGELYTFVTNKNGRGKKGTLVASIKGTLSKDIIEVLEKLPLSSRKLVKEVTLDMARNMETAVKSCFPDADLVTDRFHVVKLAIDALQHVRVKLRWEEVDKENQAIQEAKNKGVKYITIALKNGDTPKQLLARCRYILAKKQSNWTENQIVRAEILFEQYPVLKQAYNHTMAFRNIYENKRLDTAKEQFESWINKSLNQNIKEFNTVANSLQYNLDNILNFFKNRNTNANAESFNSKIKLFRANLRGVTDTPFFLFRLQNLFA
jgi:transposase